MSNQSSTKHFAQEARPYLAELTKVFLSNLEEKGIILRKIEQDGNVKYSFIGSPNTLKEDSIPTLKRDSLSDSLEFKSFYYKIFRHLPESLASKSISMFDLISNLSDKGVIPKKWKENRELFELIESDQLNAVNEKVGVTLDSMLQRTGLSLNAIIPPILEYFGSYKVLSRLEKLDYKSWLPDAAPENRFDLILQHESAGLKRPMLFFEFRWRKYYAIPSKSNLVRFLERIQQIEPSKRFRSHFVIVVFTPLPMSSFQKAYTQFSELTSAKDIQGNRIHFMPVSLDNMEYIDRQLDQFSQANIQLNQRFIFRNQRPPKLYPDRNDHFFGRVFEFKKTVFTITINPGSTKHWRFGFQFSKTTDFPDLLGGRHDDDEFPSIQIAVGDLEYLNDDPNWKNESNLQLSSYHIEDVVDFNSITSSYDGSPITLICNSIPDRSETHFDLIVGGISIYEKFYRISNFNYCRLFGWCDYKPFELDTEIVADYYE